MLNHFSAKLCDISHLTIWSPVTYMDLTEWLELFRPFTSVRTLHAYGFRLQNIADAFELVVDREMADELFPALLLLCFEPLLDQIRYEPRREPREVFVPKFHAARLLSGPPLTIVGAWEFLDVVWSC